MATHLLKLVSYSSRKKTKYFPEIDKFNLLKLTFTSFKANCILQLILAYVVCLRKEISSTPACLDLFYLFLNS